MFGYTECANTETLGCQVGQKLLLGVQQFLDRGTDTKLRNSVHND